MADIVEKNGDVAFHDVHPTATGGKGKRTNGVDLPAWGGSDGKESNFVRCKQCGFLVNKKRNPQGSGYGNTEQEIFPSTTFDSPKTEFDEIGTLFDGNYGNLVGSAGCPFCSASEFE